MGVWRERLRDVILRGGPHLPVGGGATPGGPWRSLVREWARLRRSFRLLRAVSVALLFFVLAVRQPACFSIALHIKNINSRDTVLQ